MNVKKTIFLLMIAGWLIGGHLEEAQAQRTQRDRQGERRNNNDPSPLPDDQRLLALHRQFVSDAEQLALEYERDDSIESAMAVYTEILKLVPLYMPAQQKLEALRQRMATAERVEFEVAADENWQDSGVRVQAGKPVSIRAIGSWTFNLSRELGPGGMEIPEELRDYNLGCLIAVINTGNPEEAEPFVVGEETSFVADRTGRLLFRMYDVDPRDNEGSLQVEIMGTFDN